MKRMLLGCFAGAAIVLAGCGLPSVYPFYTEKDVVFDPGLLGTWVDAGTNEHTGGPSTTFTKKGDNEYTIQDPPGTNAYTAHLFRLKNQLFLDCVPQIDNQLIPAHILLKVERIGPTFRSSFLSEDWVKDTLKQNPKALRHLVDENSGIILTADTEELQKFLIDNMGAKEAFEDEKEMKRR